MYGEINKCVNYHIW